MIYPSIIIDNFFNDPDEIRDIGLSLEKTENKNAYPGKRTKPLHLVHKEFFNWSTNKIASTVFNNQPEDFNLTFDAYQTFQFIKPNPKEGHGWIHNDNSFEFTAIVYLSKHKNCGTSLFKRKEGCFPVQKNSFVDNNIIKKEYYGSNKKYDQRYFNARDEQNQGYERTVKVESIYNRLFLFDSFQFHGVENFYDPKLKEDRMTLITFFSNINGAPRLPIPNTKRYL